jgi:hypothetical protein
VNDIISMDDLNLDNTETLKSKGFGNMSLEKLLKDNELQTKSSGLASLLDGQSHQYNPTNIDPMILNEILKSVRDKNNYIEDKFTTLEDQIFDLKKITTVNSKVKLIKELKNKKRSLYFTLFGFLTIGFILGSISFTKDEPVVVLNKKIIAVKEILAQKVTTKFTNLRSKNSPKSKILTTIAPSQIVTVIETNGGWAKVSYHNRLNGSKTVGHLWTKYLSDLK